MASDIHRMRLRDSMRMKPVMNLPGAYYDCICMPGKLNQVSCMIFMTMRYKNVICLNLFFVNISCNGIALNERIKEQSFSIGYDCEAGMTVICYQHALKVIRKN